MNSSMIRIISIVLILSFLTACTKTTRIPESDYDTLEPTGQYHVKTVHGSIHTASQIELADSSLIIIQPIGSTFDPEEYPKEFSLQEIELVTVVGDISVSRVVGFSALILVGLAVVAASTGGPFLD
jgi:hypothetical protein